MVAKAKSIFRTLSALDHPECLLLAALLSVAGIIGIGFLFDMPVSSLPFWISFGGIPVALALCRRWRSAALFVGLASAAWILTAYSFGYVGWDVCTCHFPMADAMRRGWNPVHEASAMALYSYCDGYDVKFFHVLYDPKFHALVSSAVSSATGLFSALPFAGYVVMIVLAAAVWRFARNVLDAGRLLAAACVLLGVFYCKRFAGNIQGCSDYLLYVSGLCATLSGLTWSKTSEGRDLFVCLGTAAIMPLARFNGAGVCLVLLAFFGCVSWRKRAYWIGLCAVAAYFVAVGYAPYFTNPWPLPNLTADFACNADGAKMGWFARMVYFWFSQDLALWGCRVVMGFDLRPVFSTNSIHCLNGHGGWFRACMLVAIPLAFLSRGWRVQVCAALLFCASVAVPVKYMGYERYFPLVYPVPFLMMLNFGCRPRMSNVRGVRAVRTVLTALAVVASVCVMFRVAMLADYFLSLEAVRQQRFAVLRDLSTRRRTVDCPADRDASYAVLRRAEAAGFAVTEEKHGSRLVFGAPWRLIPEGKGLDKWAWGNARHEKWEIGKDRPWRRFRPLEYRWGGFGFPLPLFDGGAHVEVVR